MAQYKTIPSELLGPELARKCYQDYERGVDQPDESEVEAVWRQTRQALGLALRSLTGKQREIVVRIAVQGKTETAVAKELGINQSTVSRQYAAAISKTRKILDNQ